MRYEFRIYWPPRKESVDACADKLHRYLLVLSAAGFKHFYKLGWSKKKAMQSPIALEIAKLGKDYRTRNSKTLAA